MALSNLFYQSCPHALCLAALLCSVVSGSVSPASGTVVLSPLSYGPLVAVPFPFPDSAFKDNAWIPILLNSN